MEKHKCRFCLKSFINERSLSVHLKSHMLNLSSKQSQLSSDHDDDETESDSSSSSSSSETESSKINNSTRKRSKRTRKLGSYNFEFKKIKTSQPCTEPELEQELHSSASDTTTEEDLAFCLIMLSRDKWKQQQQQHNNNKKQAFEETEQDYKWSKNRGGGRYKCETCNKEFKSYQALGGHRASHKKNKTLKTEQGVKTEYLVNGTEEMKKKKKVHQCPICYRVFSSGQALGGHKRSHGTQIVRIEEEEEGLVMQKQRMIDLNLPPTSNEDEDDDDETSSSFVFDQW